tara:strand:- start:737 stop:895 length:159 start_codon:yes stop_codon:yes gene_type:complete
MSQVQENKQGIHRVLERLQKELENDKDDPLVYMSPISYTKRFNCSYRIYELW